VEFATWNLAGIAGFTEAQDHLEHVATTKQRIDQTKEATLEEISKLVLDINQQLNVKKNKLAPQIKDLRTARQKFVELEVQFLPRNAPITAHSTCYSLRATRASMSRVTGCAHREEKTV
jgi:intraflagellar transport protein 81